MNFQTQHMHTALKYPFIMDRPIEVGPISIEETITLHNCLATNTIESYAKGISFKTKLSVGRITLSVIILNLKKTVM